ncbi:MAG: NTP transferase domain-containing protein [Deltaproteobacteria bacterium]|nr:NTP transferase domain-containing protein [Deltaproteobacteria bacterium]
MQRVPAIVTAGDGKASRAVYGDAKVYLDLAGRALVSRTVGTLMRVPEVSEVWVVGNAERLEKTLREDRELVASLTKPVYVVPQFGNLYENAWQTFRRLLPGAPPEGRDPQGDAELDQRVLYLSADLPFATPQEISVFIQRAVAAGCDYGLGLVTEDSLAPFYPDRGKPGIELAYFNVANGRVRQSNLHVVRPGRLGHRWYIEHMYEHRYQKELFHALALAWRILTLEGGGISLVLYFAVMHLAGLFDRMRLRGIADSLRQFVSFERINRACSQLLATRFQLIVTEVGGSGLDIDSERDIDIARERFEEWTTQQAEYAATLHGVPLLPADAGSSEARITRLERR